MSNASIVTIYQDSSCMLKLENQSLISSNSSSHKTLLIVNLASTDLFTTYLNIKVKDSDKENIIFPFIASHFPLNHMFNCVYLSLP